MLVPNPHRDPLRMAHNVRASAAALHALRPRLVVSSGANVAVAFCLMARLRGVPLVFAETMARTRRPSASARILAPFASRVLVQWPELLGRLPRAELCRPALLEDLPARRPRSGVGSFATAGGHGQPFDRLVRLCDEAAAGGALPPPVLVQARVRTYQPRHATLVETIPREEMPRRIAEAAAVITHGGAGTIALALGCGQVPLVLPRLASEREHVDDHQVEMVAELAALGLVVRLDRLSVADALRAAEAMSPSPTEAFPGARMVERLAEIVEELAP